jgi:hypothetical protein
MKMWLAHERLSRCVLLSGALVVLFAVGGCEWDGHVNFLGYTTKPNIPDNIKTVYIPIFKNKVFQTGPYRGMEYLLTRDVVAAVEMKGFKVISDPNRADTELLGTIVNLNKNVLNRTLQNEVREGSVILGVEIVWRDLRTGIVLTNPPRQLGTPPATDLPPFDQDNLPRPDSLEKAIPVMVQLDARFLPEVGESNATAVASVCLRLAQQITNMMEKDWRLPPKPIPTPDMIPPEQR